MRRSESRQHSIHGASLTLGTGRLHPTVRRVKVAVATGPEFSKFEPWVFDDFEDSRFPVFVILWMFSTLAHRCSFINLSSKYVFDAFQAVLYHISTSLQLQSLLFFGCFRPKTHAGSRHRLLVPFVFWPFWGPGPFISLWWVPAIGTERILLRSSDSDEVKICESGQVWPPYRSQSAEVAGCGSSCASG